MKNSGHIFIMSKLMEQATQGQEAMSIRDRDHITFNSYMHSNLSDL